MKQHYTPAVKAERGNLIVTEIPIPSVDAERDAAAV
jgi:hypothetical protein